MNLRDLFDLSFSGRRDHVALEWEDAAYTFGDLDARSNRAAHALAARGLSRGDRVCLYLANRIEMIDLYLAAIKLGLIFVPMNILYREREISHILSDAEPKLFITEKELPELAKEAVAQPAELAKVPLDGDTPAALVYTSGTTGTSKGAILTHNNFAANALNLLTCWQITDRDRFLLALPLFRLRRPSFSISDRRCFSACPPCMCGCLRRLRMPRARSAARCGCLFRDRPRCRLRCSRIFVGCSDIRSSNATA
jgi:malonyl-CoA/methylmalonyl-CoA synthetase